MSVAKGEGGAGRGGGWERRRPGNLPGSGDRDLPNCHRLPKVAEDPEESIKVGGEDEDDPASVRMSRTAPAKPST